MFDIKQSTALDLLFFAHDENGDAVTGVTDGSFTKRISKNGAAFGAMTVTITERENGWYHFQASTSHTDTLGILSITFTASGIKQVNLQYMIRSKVVGDEVEIIDDGITSSKIAANAIGASELATDAVNEIRDAILSDSTAFNGADIAAIVADTNELQSDDVPGLIAALNDPSVTEIRSLVTGTADSGTTLTLVDSGRTESGNDYWRGCLLLITSGSIANQVRQIVSFDPGTDTITVDRAFTAAVSTNTYEILPFGSVDITRWRGTLPAGLDGSGRVEATVGNVQNDVLTAAALATDAVNEIRDAILADSTAFNGADIAAILTDTADMQPKLGTPAVDISADIAAIKAETAAILADTNELQTDDVPGLIAALNDISTAEVNAEVDTALSDIGLDHLLSAAVIGTDVVDNSVFAKLVSKSATADWDDFVNTTDSLQAARDNIGSSVGADISADIAAVKTDTAATLVDTADMQPKLGSPATDISADIAAIKAETALIVADTNELQTDDVPGLIAALNDLSAAQVNTEVSDVLKTDTIAERGVAAPPATPTFEEAIMYMYMGWRNNSQSDSTSGERRIKNNAGTTIAKAVQTDSGTLYSQGTMVSG